MILSALRIQGLITSFFDFLVLLADALMVALVLTVTAVVVTANGLAHISLGLKLGRSDRFDRRFAPVQARQMT